MQDTFTNCDASDLKLWAENKACTVFEEEIASLRKQADGMVHRNLSERDAGKYDAYVKVLDIIDRYRGFSDA